MNKNFLRRPEPEFVKFQNRILDMNALAGNDIRDKSLIPTYHKLLKEELKEMVKGFATEDKNEFIDGLVDVGVIGIYLHTLYRGEAPYPIQAYGAVDPHTRLDILHTHDFQALIGNIKTHIERDGEENIYVALAEWESLCRAVDVDINAAFEEVMDSNFSKFPLKGTVDIEKEIAYIESQGRYGAVICEEKTYKNQTYLIFKARYDRENDVDFGDNPKFVKPSTFKEPQLKV